MPKLIYLAAPYSHPDPNVITERVRAIDRTAAHMFAQGHFVFSPITHCHPIHLYGLPGDYNFWQEYNKRMLSHCDELCVLMLDGWGQSLGVQGEIEFARENNKIVSYRYPIQTIPI
jgi:hypothetical protein